MTGEAEGEALPAELLQILRSRHLRLPPLTLTNPSRRRSRRLQGRVATPLWVPDWREERRGLKASPVPGKVSLPPEHPTPPGVVRVRLRLKTRRCNLQPSLWREWQCLHPDWKVQPGAGAAGTSLPAAPHPPPLTQRREGRGRGGEGEGRTLRGIAAPPGSKGRPGATARLREGRPVAGAAPWPPAPSRASQAPTLPPKPHLRAACG